MRQICVNLLLDSLQRIQLAVFLWCLLTQITFFKRIIVYGKRDLKTTLSVKSQPIKNNKSHASQGKKCFSRKNKKTLYLTEIQRLAYLLGTQSRN